VHLDKISIEHQLNMDDSITEMESRLQFDLILFFKVEGLSDN